MHDYFGIEIRISDRVRLADCIMFNRGWYNRTDRQIATVAKVNGSEIVLQWDWRQPHEYLVREDAGNLVVVRRIAV